MYHPYGYAYPAPSPYYYGAGGKLVLPVTAPQPHPPTPEIAPPTGAGRRTRLHHQPHRVAGGPWSANSTPQTRQQRPPSKRPTALGLSSEKTAEIELRMQELMLASGQVSAGAAAGDPVAQAELAALKNEMAVLLANASRRG